MQTPATETPSTETVIPEGPTATVRVGETTFTLLGTAHVSKASALEVERLVESGRFDAVAIELDDGRYRSITDPDRYRKLDLFQVFREGKAGAMMANLALSAFQQRLAEQEGIEPGQEMRVAISSAKEAGLPLLLVDREIGTTLRRVYRNIPWWRRMVIMAGLSTSVISNEKIDAQEIEKLKEGDLLEATFSEFAENSAELYAPLISERDEYMALKLLQLGLKHDNVLVVIGAGHLKGLKAHLEQAAQQEAVPGDDLRRRTAELEEVPPPSQWTKAIPWLIVGIILLGFGIGFLRSPDLGLSLLSDWFLINGTLAATGALVALSHPLTIVASFLAAPFTSLNPLVGAGFVAAAVELWFRKPQVADFESLRKDVTTVRGWWRNRVARTFLVFLFVTLGSAAATYIAGARVFTRLFGG